HLCLSVVSSFSILCQLCPRPSVPLSLVCMPSHKGLLDIILNLRLRLPPVRSQQLILGCQPEKTLNPNLGIQDLKEIHDQIDVFLIPKKRERLLQVLAPE